MDQRRTIKNLPSLALITIEIVQKVFVAQLCSWNLRVGKKARITVRSKEFMARIKDPYCRESQTCDTIKKSPFVSYNVYSVFILWLHSNCSRYSISAQPSLKGILHLVEVNHTKRLSGTFKLLCQNVLQLITITFKSVYKRLDQMPG